MEPINERLRAAARNGSEMKLKSLLQDPACNPLEKDISGMTALMHATSYGKYACVRLLLPVSDPLAKDRDDWTALMWAAYNGHEECVKVLMHMGNAKARAKDGMTALMWAARGGHDSCIRILLPVSDASAKDKDGLTASDWARKRSFEISARFIDAYVLAQSEQVSIGSTVKGKCFRKRASPRV